MNMKTVIPLGLAIILGLVAAVMVRNTIAHHGAPVATSSNLVSVVVAKGDIDPGKALSKEDLTVARVPAELAPGHVFSDSNLLVGRVVLSPLSKGQTVMEGQLAASGAGSGLQVMVPPGMRAVTIEVNEFSSVGGMLEPGCHVDLVANITDPKTHEAMCRTILQNVRIIAMGRSVTPPHPADGQPLPPPTNSITLLLNPRQVQTLQLAAMTGRPWFALRGGKDDKEINIPSMPIAELRGEGKDGNSEENAQPPVATAPVTNSGPFTQVNDPAPEQPKTERHTVTIIRNGVETKQVFIVPVTPVPAPESDSTVNTDTSLVPGTK